MNGRLVSGRHVAAAPVLGATDRPASRIEHDHESGQVLVRRTQAIVRPRTEARAATENLSRVHHQHRRAMDRRVGGDRMDEGDIIDAGGQVREQRGNPLSTFAVLGELPRRLDDPALVLVSAAAKRLHVDYLIVHAFHGGLVVKRIDVAWTTVHVKENHALGLRRKMRRSSGQRIGPRSNTIGGKRLAGQEAIVA